MARYQNVGSAAQVPTVPTVGTTVLGSGIANRSGNVTEPSIFEPVAERSRPVEWADVPQPAEQTPAPEDPTGARHVAELRAANNRLLRDNEKNRASKAELVEAVYRAAETAFSALDIRPVQAPKPDKRSATSETAICVLSDWQLGKKTESYSSDICRQRIELYAEKVAKITNMRRTDHPVKECRVYLLGDMIEGEMIFPGQAWRVDSSLFRQLCVDGPDILGSFLRSMLAQFERVRVVAVPGNHGRIGGRAGKESHPETNADLMLYEIVRREFRAEPRLEWGEPPGIVKAGGQPEGYWCAFDTIGTKTALLFHGDNVKGHAGYPWYGFGRKLQGLSMLGQFFSERSTYRPFHYAFAGHFHTENKMYVNGVRFWASPSTESGNEYAASELASAGEPGQLLLFAHPRRGIVAESCVALWEDDAEDVA